MHLAPLLAIRQRLPTRKQSFLLWTACAFVIYFWSILNVLRSAQSLMMRLQLQEAIIVTSYTQAFALIESIVIFIALILAGIILPKRFLRDNWAAKGGIVIFLTALWMGSFHLLPVTIRKLVSVLEDLSRASKIPLTEPKLLNLILIVGILIWLGLYFILLRRLYKRINKKTSFASTIQTALARLAIPTILYALLSIFACIILTIHLLR